MWMGVNTTDDVRARREANAGRDAVHVTRVAQLSDVSPAVWDRLVSDSTTGTVFQLYAWQQIWWKHFGTGHEALILLAHDDVGELVGIAPLALRRTSILGRRVNTVTFAGVPQGNYADFVTGDRSEDVLRAFVRWLVAHHDLWSSIQLRNIVNTSLTFTALPALMTAEGLMVTSRLNAEAPMLELSTDPGSDDRWTKKKDIRQKERRLRAAGTVTVQRLWDVDETVALLPEFFRQHIARHEAASSMAPSQYLDERYKRLLEAQVRSLSPVRLCGVDVLKFNGAPIAFQVFLVDPPSSSIILKMPSYDPAYARYSPGNVLLSHTFQLCRDAGFTRVDFSSGEARYKYRFTNRVRSVNSIAATTNYALHFGLLIRWRTKDQLRRIRRRFPTQADALKRARRRSLSVLRNMSSRGTEG
jgi:CelD/BcsL family acetyltransferase involved in cellulose biosynthesis